MKTVVAPLAGFAGLVLVATVGLAADKPAGTAAAKPPASAAPISAAPASAAPSTAAPMPTTPPKPGPEHDALKWWVGTWKCKGAMETSPMGPGHPTEGTMTFKSTTGGFFVEGAWKEKKTKDAPVPSSGRMTLGYNSFGKVYQMSWMGSMGEMSLGTSKGWEGDKLTWTTADAGMTMKDTYTKVSDKEVNLDSTVTMAGKTSPMMSINCKK